MQRMERSGGGGSHQRRISAISHMPQLTEYCLGALDSISSAGLVEVGQCCSFLACRESHEKAFQKKKKRKI